MFTIELASENNQVIDSVFHRKFRIIIDDMSEIFMSPLSYWSVSDYFGHWRTSIEKIASRKVDRSIFITEMYDPGHANFIRYWVAYAESSSVFFQENILFLDDVKRPFDLDNIHLFIPNREIINEDGDQISEWAISLEEIKKSPLLVGS